MGETKLFLGGVPTDIDVEKLREHLGTLKHGDMIPYQEISDCLGIQKGECRWYSVVSAWRKRLDRENNILLKAIPNEGYRVLDGHGRVEASAWTYKKGLRRIHRATVIASKTDRNGLDENEIKTLDHIQNTGASLRLAAATAARQIDYDKAMERQNIAN
jgi:hypothetical protein